MTPAKKLTITIPDDLAERLAPYRDRLNLSDIATDAFDSAVTALELQRDVQILTAALLSKPGAFDLLKRWHGVNFGDDHTEGMDPVDAEVWNFIEGMIGLDEAGDCKDDVLAGWARAELQRIAETQYGTTEHRLVWTPEDPRKTIGETIKETHSG